MNDETDKARGTVLILLQPHDPFSSRADVVYQASPARARGPPLRQVHRAGARLSPLRAVLLLFFLIS